MVDDNESFKRDLTDCLKLRAKCRETGGKQVEIDSLVVQLGDMEGTNLRKEEDRVRAKLQEHDTLRSRYQGLVLCDVNKICMYVPTKDE